MGIQRRRWPHAGETARPRGATVTAAAALPLQGVTSATAAAGKGGDREWRSAWPRLAAGWWRTTTALGGCAFLRKNDREERRSAGVAAIDGGAVKEARSSGATAARGCAATKAMGRRRNSFWERNRLGQWRCRRVAVQGTTTQRRSGWRRGCRRQNLPPPSVQVALRVNEKVRKKGKDLENHQVKSMRLPEKGKDLEKPSGQTDKIPLEKPSGGKEKDLENHQVKLINSWKTIRRKGKKDLENHQVKLITPGKPSGGEREKTWKTIRRKGKRPGKPSGLTDKNSWKTIRKKGKRPGKPSGQTDKLLENHKEEKEKTWKTISWVVPFGGRIGHWLWYFWGHQMLLQQSIIEGGFWKVGSWLGKETLLTCGGAEFPLGMFLPGKDCGSLEDRMGRGMDKRVVGSMVRIVGRG
ncbi:hypothetical protein SESBI_10700 [Sesbania bispinosa]|nr:hypothetical protein SESBI_10700 [Sesbania bispinosa]